MRLPDVERRWLILIGLIAGGVALRAIDFDAPIFDHHWLRQVDTAAIARNFEENMNILYPSVDWRGASTGYVESEFPLYTYLVALLYPAFGEHAQIGRGLNIAFFIATAICLFDFGRRLFDERRALLAAFFYCFNPLAAFFAHSFQPDTLMLLMTVCALNFFWRWTQGGSALLLAFSALALGTAILIKPLNLYLGVPLAYLCYRRFGSRMLAVPQLWVFAAAALIPAALWYHHAYQLWIEHGNTLFRAYSDMSRGALWGRDFPLEILSLNDRSYASELVARTVGLIAAIGGLLPLAIGALAAIKERNGFLICWVAGFLATMVVFAEQHGAHDYYQLPMVLVAALLMADGTATLWSGRQPVRWLAAGLGVLYLLAEIWLWRLPFRETLNESAPWMLFVSAGFLLLAAFAVMPRPHRALVVASLLLALTYSAWRTDTMTEQASWIEARQAFGELLRRLTPEDARIIVADQNDRPNWYQHRTAQGEYLGYMPTDFYLSQRKGWNVFHQHAVPHFVETLRQRGATHFAVWCCAWGEQRVHAQYPRLTAYLECAHTPLHVTEQILIYQLSEPGRRPDGSSCMPH